MANSSLTRNCVAAPGIATDSSSRLLSLDVLRGITIAFMIMVNNQVGPGAWRELQHSYWNGLTATDVVFPTFMFVVGITTVFSMEARLARGAKHSQLAWYTLKRAVVLFVLGIVVNGFPYFQLAHLRIYGVLQRIAICYLVVGLFYLFDRRAWTKVVVLAVVLLGYWVLVRWVPIPGAGLPGRDIPFLDRNQNVVAWVDRHLLPGHLYRKPPLFNTRDPEGLLSDIPALGSVLIGLLAGLWLRTGKALRDKALGLVAGAVFCLIVGYAWSIWFPLNKKMWTSSFVLVCAGWSLALLALVYWAIEEKGLGGSHRSKAWVWPWIVFGSNAIVAYMISELLPSALRFVEVDSGKKRSNLLLWVYWHIFIYIHDPGWRAFIFSVVFTAICFVPVWIMYRKRIFVKV